MKISYNWLKEFIDADKTPEEISQILTKIGLEVESLEKVQSIPGGLEGLVIGFVKERQQHPNADRLSITRVDVGRGEDLQVVCGAANVAAGQKVVVATVGTTVHPVSGEPFKINKSKIRGEVSEGMICAEDEIGLGHSHDGIMVLDESAVVGTPAKEYFKLEDDYVFEIGLTPNRADAASHLGVARDLAAYLKKTVVLPDVSALTSTRNDLNIPVDIQNNASCRRYSSLTISGVEVKESPDWLKSKLNAISVRPINNVVDVTNYVLHELGQPLHAFDADAIRGGRVLVKNCEEGTLFTTLDGVERKLSSEDLMICNEEEPMCIAGVLGGAGSGVRSETRNIFLESAYFDAVSIRKTSKRHGIKTDASFRFERGTDPEITVLALKRAAQLILQVAGGHVSSEISDLYPDPLPAYRVGLAYRNADRLIGKSLGREEIKGILTALNIQILSEAENGLELSVPTYKVDVTREVDVIEEVLRIYGYDNIEIPVQIRASLNYASKPDKEVVQNLVAEVLSANGYYEILTNSLTRSAYADEPEQAVRILNPLSSDLDIMRQTLLYSGLEAITYNQNRKNPDLRFYEFGKTYFRTEKGFQENQRLSLFLTGATQQESWNAQPGNVGFFSLKAAVDAICGKLNLKDLQIEEAGEHAHLAYGLSYKKGDKILVSFGEIRKAVLKQLEVDKAVYYADFDWDLILKSIRKNKITYREVSKFPAVRRDLSMLLDKKMTFNQLKQIAQRTEKNLLKEVGVFDVYEGDKLPEGKKSYALSFILQDEEKTLTDKQIEAIMLKLIANFEKEAGAEVRK